MDGGQCLIGATQLYDAAGKIRADLIALQGQAKAALAASQDAEKRPR